LGLAEPDSEKLTVCYARVSSHDQKEHLKTQALRLEQHCAAQDWQSTLTLQDLGSGLNYKKPGLAKLLRLILSGRCAGWFSLPKTAYCALAPSWCFRSARRWASKL
jgi:predicted site-specific integrase-resolvase